VVNTKPASARREFLLQGADSKTGAIRELRVIARDEDEARARASDAGVLVASVSVTFDSMSHGSKPPSPQGIQFQCHVCRVGNLGLVSEFRAGPLVMVLGSIIACISALAFIGSGVQTLNGVSKLATANSKATQMAEAETTRRDEDWRQRAIEFHERIGVEPTDERLKYPGPPLTADDFSGALLDEAIRTLGYGLAACVTSSIGLLIGALCFSQRRILACDSCRAAVDAAR
jgi:hypothetical protein